MADHDIAPSGCRYCGVGRDEHLRRWDAVYKTETGDGWHEWIAPTLAQFRERVHARRAARKAGSRG